MSRAMLTISISVLYKHISTCVSGLQTTRVDRNSSSNHFPTRNALTYDLTEISSQISPEPKAVR